MAHRGVRFDLWRRPFVCAFGSLARCLVPSLVGERADRLRRHPRRPAGSEGQSRRDPRSAPPLRRAGTHYYRRNMASLAPEVPQPAARATVVLGDHHGALPGLISLATGGAVSRTALHAVRGYSSDKCEAGAGERDHLRLRACHLPKLDRDRDDCGWGVSFLARAPP